MAPKMTGVFVPDCACDRMDLAQFPVVVSHFGSDDEAVSRYLVLRATGLLLTEAVHGPSGHLLNVVRR